MDDKELTREQYEEQIRGLKESLELAVDLLEYFADRHLERLTQEAEKSACVDSGA